MASLATAAQGNRHDKRLWTAIARETGAQGNSTSLLGTVDQVADSLMAYDDLGATQILIRGFEPLEHALAYGALIRRRHEFVTKREREQVAAE